MRNQLCLYKIAFCQICIALTLLHQRAGLPLAVGVVPYRRESELQSGIGKRGLGSNRVLLSRPCKVLPAWKREAQPW
jgi:hypothetical protein